MSSFLPSFSRSILSEQGIWRRLQNGHTLRQMTDTKCVPIYLDGGGVSILISGISTRGSRLGDLTLILGLG